VIWLQARRELRALQQFWNEELRLQNFVLATAGNAGI
jgi:hypothetical protein